MIKSTGQVRSVNRAQRRAAARVQRRRRSATAAQISATGLILAAGIGVIGVSPARAVPTTFTVTSPMDGLAVPGSLRDAIDQANLNPGADTIVFDASVTGTIFLTEGPLDIQDSVTIVGPGAALLSVDANSNSRVMTMAAPPLPGLDVDVSLSGLTIANGFASSGSGGGISASNVNLSLTNTVLSGNVADRNGGGIAFDGALDAANSLSITNSELRTNYANYYYGYGGAIYVVGAMNASTVSITGSTLSENGARWGGAAYVKGYYLSSEGTQLPGVSIAGSTFENNEAGGDGGAVNIETVTGSVSIVGSSFTGNVGEDGGGLFIGQLYDGSSVSVSDTEFDGNEATRTGGGFAVSFTADGSVLTINDTTVTGNSAQSGGGLSINRHNGTASVVDSAIVDNSAAYYGGGLMVRQSTANASIVIERTTVSGNVAAQDGGAVRFYLLDGSMTFIDSAIEDNTAGDNGGGVAVRQIEVSGAIAVEGSSMTGNIAAEDGGAMYLDDLFGSLSIDDSTIDDNVAGDAGGGIYVSYLYYDSNMSISSSTVSRNSAGGNGGGIYLYDMDAPLTIVGTEVSDNTASDDGGGVFVRDAYEMTIENSTLAGNASGGDGGAVFAQYGELELINSTLSGNEALAVGGGVSTRSAAVNIEHSTIVENSGLYGGGIVTYGGSATLDHVIVADNTATASEADLLTAVGSFDLKYSLVGDQPASGLGVVDAASTALFGADPQLGALANNGGPTRTHLPAGSGAGVDAGDPAIVAVSTDQRGKARPVDVIDIGAVEVQGGTVNFVDATATVSEETGTLVVSVTRDGSSERAGSVTVTPTFGTTVAADVSFAPTTVSWAAGETGAKSVNVGVVLDALHEDDETLTLSLTDADGVTVGAASSMVITVVNSNSAPIIGDVADISLAASTPSGAIAIAVDDDEQDAADLVVTASSSNQSVVADVGLLVGGAGAARTLVVSPVTGASGSSLITVTVSDGKLTSTDTFTVTVGAAGSLLAPPVSKVNDVPVTGGSAVTDDSTPTISGTGQSGAQIDVYLTGNALLAPNAAPEGLKLCTTTVNSAGQWSCTVSSPLPVGSYSLAVVQTLGAETSSASTFRLQVTNGGALPATGNSSEGLAWFGAGLVGLGALLTGAGRRRRTTK
jgi:LPXTG-motif cell wall-anchored protein